jgi:hypothetical protein
MVHLHRLIRFTPPLPHRSPAASHSLLVRLPLAGGPGWRAAFPHGNIVARPALPSWARFSQACACAVSSSVPTATVGGIARPFFPASPPATAVQRFPARRSLRRHRGTPWLGRALPCWVICPSDGRMICAASSSSPPLITAARSRFFHSLALGQNDDQTPHSIAPGHRHKKRPSTPRILDRRAGRLRPDDVDIEIFD